MLAVILVVLCLAGLFGFTYYLTQSDRRASAILASVVLAYLARILFHLVLEDLPVFSHGNARGDSMLYEFQGLLISKIWEREGIGPVDHALVPQFERVTLPGYVFGFISYLNGDMTLVGCVAVVALVGCLTCLNLYDTAKELGADPKMAYRVLLLTLFSPGFILYTADTSKDGFVAFFGVNIICGALRLAKQFRTSQALLIALSAFCLWYTRHYLVFMTVGPVAFALQGLKTRSLLRPALLALVVLAFGMLLIAYTTALESVRDQALATFEHATDENVLQANSETGSGVRFEGSGPWDFIHLKLLYTMFAPFPWQLGSIGMQIGKLDTIVWYYMLYRMYLAARARWRDDRVLVLFFLLFLVPSTVAYATTMSNIGLMFRQRLPIVLIGQLFALLSWPAPGAERASEASPASDRAPTATRRRRIRAAA